MLGTVFSTAFNAIMPLVLLILLGYWLKRIGFLSKDFCKTSNKLIFNVLLPCTLFFNIYNIQGFSAINWSVVIFSVGGTFALLCVGLVVAATSTTVPERKGVMGQVVFRSNFLIIGLPLAGALGGQGAVEMAAVVSGFTIPFFNIFGVIMLSVFVKQPGDTHPMRNTIRSILRNPQILASVAGLSVLLLRELQGMIWGHTVFSIQGHLPFLYKAIKDLTGITTAFSLVILGADFSFYAIKGAFREVILGTCCRLIIAPVLTLGAAYLMGLAGWLNFGANEYATMIAFFGSPTAVSGAVMAKQMSNDGDLATQLVVWTSIFSILTIFLQVCILAAARLI